MRLSSLILTLVHLLSLQTLIGQEKTPIDTPYRQAQVLVQNQQFNEAIEVIEQYAQTSVLDRDYELYLVRLYFWNKQSDIALEKLNNFLVTWPNDYQAHTLHIDIYESQDQYTLAYKQIQNAIALFPDDSKLKYRLAYNLYLQEDYEEAKKHTKVLVSAQPDNKYLTQLDSDLTSKLLKNFVQVEYRNYFLTQRDQRLDFQIYKYGRHIGKSTLIGQIISGRSNTNRGIQTGLEYYRVIDKTTYSFFQIAYSPSELFPDLRINAALYFHLKRNFQSSFFISYLKVDQELTKVISPSLTKNIGLAAFSGTANIINRDSNIEVTYRVSYRQNLKGGRNFVGLAYGSLSRNEMIRGDELFVTANYISYETRWSLGRKIHIGLVYNRTITDRAKNRDQLNIYAKHDF